MELKKIIREPAYFFMMLLFPAVLSLLFGLLFGTTPSAISGKSMFDIMAPGIFAYACIFITMIVAQTFCDDREFGLLKRITTTPTTSSEFILSHIISNTLLSLLQVVVVTIIIFLIGFRPEGGIIGFFFAFLFITLLSICSVGFGLITATIAKNSGSATALSFIFILPQMFFGTFIPLNETTTLIAIFFPSYYATESIKMIFNGSMITNPIIWIYFLMLGLMSIGIITIGILLFEKYGKN